MKYIGPFFRMNSLSTKEVESQLLFFCRESLKHIVLESRCGMSITPKDLKSYRSNTDLSYFKNNNPLICIYKKAKPTIYSSKYSKSWDESTFKKDVPISSNALMTLSLLECTQYYDSFRDIDDNLSNLSNLYKSLSKQQLEFYYNNLRNNEGYFVDKKTNSNSTHGEFSLSDRGNKHKFSDQSYMMLAYYMYSITCPEDLNSKDYEGFSMEILDMFIHFKNEIYTLSLEECCKICFCLNIMYKYSKNDECGELLVDLCEYSLSKYRDTNPSLSNIEVISLLSLNLLMCYNNTNISFFKDAYIDIMELLYNLYNSDKNIIQKPTDKKEIKYSSSEIILYLLNMINYNNLEDTSDVNNIISPVYRQYCVNSGLITSFPEAPNLDSSERYLNLSLRSSDLLDETMFRMPNSSSPELTGLASSFLKNITYSIKKETFSSDKTSFDSSRNMFLFYTILNQLLPKYTLLLTKAYRNTSENENTEILFNNIIETYDTDYQPTIETITETIAESTDINNSNNDIVDVVTSETRITSETLETTVNYNESSESITEESNIESESNLSDNNSDNHSL